MPVSWNAENAAHLLHRAGFGATKKEIDAAVAKGMAKTVARLFKVDTSKDKPKQDFESLERAQTWWVRRMLKTKSPLVEKLVLFWHNHFATAYSKVQSLPLLHQQNRTLRKRCLGPFRELLLAVARDPAMIHWLDNDTNVAAAPNENFARELMELFTTGVFDANGAPNYTESDVQEAARAFTGWTFTGKTFQFADAAHDFGMKTVKGVAGPLDGTDVIDVLAVDAATARRVAWKLFCFFAYPTDLADSVLDPFAQSYLEHDTRIKPVLQQLFTSEAFYSDAAKLARVKSPAEFLVGSIRMLSAVLPKQFSVAHEIGTSLQQMGQSLFDPPSVFGWDEGIAWTSSSGMLQRMRLAERIADARSVHGDAYRWRPVAILGSVAKWAQLDAQDVVDKLLKRFSITALPATRAAMIAYLGAPYSGGPTKFSVDEDAIETKVRGLVALCLSCPEYQFC